MGSDDDEFVHATKFGPPTTEFAPSLRDFGHQLRELGRSLAKFCPSLRLRNTCGAYFGPLTARGGLARRVLRAASRVRGDEPILGGPGRMIDEVSRPKRRYGPTPARVSLIGSAVVAPSGVQMWIAAGS